MHTRVSNFSCGEQITQLLEVSCMGPRPGDAEETLSSLLDHYKVWHSLKDVYAMNMVDYLKWKISIRMHSRGS